MTISSIDIENKKLLEEIESLKERHNIVVQSHFSSHEVLVELTMCDKCDILKNIVDNLQNTLDEF